jgi:hypothetical protein
MASTAVHFLFGAIASLVALDESDGLLNFKAAFRSFEPQAEVKNAPILLTFVVCARVLQVLVSAYTLYETHTTHAESIQARHVIVRILGTSLTVACVDSTQNTTTDDANVVLGVRTNLVSLLRRLTFRKSKILRSLAYAAAYSVVSSICVSLASNISSNYVWLACAEIVTSLLLEGLHLRWTLAIASKTSPARVMFSYPWRDLLLPALAYAVAQKLTTELPLAIRYGSSDSFDTPADALAIRSMAGLILAFTLRFFVLYPAWASLICYETGLTKRAAHRSGPRTLKQNLYCYWDTTRMCYQRVLLRLAGLHLQAAGILISIEAVAYLVFSALFTGPVEEL